jgi:hypothetical protein
MPGRDPDPSTDNRISLTTENDRREGFRSVAIADQSLSAGILAACRLSKAHILKLKISRRSPSGRACAVLVGLVTAHVPIGLASKIVLLC